MGTTYPTSALKVVQEVVQTLTGLLDVQPVIIVALLLDSGVETLQWLLTNLTGLVTGTVTVLVPLVTLVNLVLHSWALVPNSILTNVGCVVDAGPFHMLLVDKVL
jgi:hypothetical protein